MGSSLSPSIATPITFGLSKEQKYWELHQQFSDYLQQSYGQVVLLASGQNNWPSPHWQSDFEDYNTASGIEPYFVYALALQLSVKGQRFGVFSLEHARDIMEYRGNR
ncbi:hypothetical protein [Gallaecimonas xiamenensis]|uniref:hypothetical protein n=1 Tax=Gallaecimonas xiamenensis TaxID=1207039 RepID=UPI0012EA2559|nr:hypothetical protein [Gallaecimonas xiamenensis]